MIRYTESEQRNRKYTEEFNTNFRTKKYKNHNKNLTGSAQQQNGNEKPRVSKFENRSIEIILPVNKKEKDWGENKGSPTDL